MDLAEVDIACGLRSRPHGTFLSIPLEVDTIIHRYCEYLESLSWVRRVSACLSKIAQEIGYAKQL